VPLIGGTITMIDTGGLRRNVVNTRLTVMLK